MFGRLCESLLTIEIWSKTLLIVNVLCVVCVLKVKGSIYRSFLKSHFPNIVKIKKNELMQYQRVDLFA
jgi:hypothetical protein